MTTVCFCIDSVCFRQTCQVLPNHKNLLSCCGIVGEFCIVVVLCIVHMGCGRRKNSVNDPLDIYISNITYTDGLDLLNLQDSATQNF